jgi:predicted O-methyltransferase YrrM
MDGALLRCLAAGHPGGLIGEIGTGPGVSTAWLLSALGQSARLISCEIDSELAEGAAAFFAGWPQVAIRSGDWRRVLSPSEPFDLLFFDADAQVLLARRDGWDQLLELLKPGGTVVMDDLAPVEMWPSEWKGMTDHKREFSLCNPRVAGTEVRTSPTTVSLIATKLH